MARPMQHTTGSEYREKISRNAQKIRKITGHAKLTCGVKPVDFVKELQMYSSPSPTQKRKSVIIQYNYCSQQMLSSDSSWGLMLSQLQNKANRIQPYLDWSMYVWFFDAKHNLPGNSDPIKQVVDEANIVD